MPVMNRVCCGPFVLPPQCNLIYAKTDNSPCNCWYMCGKFTWITNNICMKSHFSNFAMLKLIIINFRSYLLSANKYFVITSGDFLPGHQL